MPCGILAGSPRRAGAYSLLLLAETVTFDFEERNVSGRAVPRIENASRAFLLERVAQLETALESRIVIEQAKGIVARAAGLDVDTAFELIRGASRSRRVAIHSVAAAIVAKPGEAESQLRRS
jgi:ANTAR domain